MLRLIFCLSVLLSTHAFATAQAPDYLLFEGQRYRLHTNPLEVLFNQHKDLRPASDFVSSANVRGYTATFAINDNALVVSDITVSKITVSKHDPDKKHSSFQESVMLNVLPNKSDRQLDWFSGVLVVPLGKHIEYVHQNYASQYEGYLIFLIRNGIMQDFAEMSLSEYRRFKTRQFERFKATSAYKPLYEEVSQHLDYKSGFEIESYIFLMDIGRFTQTIQIPLQSAAK